MKKIVGNGLIGRCFRNIDFSKNCLILASGVSNSKEVRESEFSREIELVTHEIESNPEATVVYFSTCSVCQGSDSAYIRHKLYMEFLVSSRASFFHIFRLPQVVGIVDNMTIVSYFVTSILRGKYLHIQKKAKRNLLDVADVARFTEKLVNDKIGINTVQNLASSKNITILEIVYEISSILMRDFEFESSDLGCEYYIDIELLKSTFGQDDFVFTNDYWRQILRKYVPLIVNNFSHAEGY